MYRFPKYFLYFTDPGCYTIFTLYFQALDNKTDYILVASGYGEKQLRKSGKDYLTLPEALVEVKEGDVFALGSQTNCEETVEIIKNLKVKGVKTVFLFDHWTRYSDHFTDRGGILNFPDKILTCDTVVNKNLIALGCSQNQLTVVGHANIEHQIKDFDNVNQEDIDEWKQSLCENQNLWLLALEPLKADFSHESYTMEFDEYKITKLVLEKLGKVKGDHKLMIRLHPRQNVEEFEAFLQRENLSSSVILCPSNRSVTESIAVSDFIIGIYSVFLIIAQSVGKPVTILRFNERDNYNVVDVPYFSNFIVKDPVNLETSLSQQMTVSNSFIFKPENSIDLMRDAIESFV
tara:strand:- start:5705 stop:6745 length:1041 start_codon:yes stop_codon:yes gene_type:complete